MSNITSAFELARRFENNNGNVESNPFYYDAKERKFNALNGINLGIPGTLYLIDSPRGV
jgi:hypothetical protein